MEKEKPPSESYIIEESRRNIIEEIRLNRAAIDRVDDKIERMGTRLSSKVGRTELFGWMATSYATITFALRNWIT